MLEKAFLSTKMHGRETGGKQDCAETLLYQYDSRCFDEDVSYFTALNYFWVSWHGLCIVKNRI